VTRPEDERDPEADAEFDRELAKLMSESAESRKFERKPVFDVPLPMRRAREATVNAEDSGNEAPVPTMLTSNTVKFSLLSKRGNKTQTRSIDLPSDSTFAVAMRNKQQADKEEQQRIKSLVLNYNEARDDGEETGDLPFHYTFQPNTNRNRTETSEVLDKTPNLRAATPRQGRPQPQQPTCSQAATLGCKLVRGLSSFNFSAKSIWVCYEIFARDGRHFAVSGGAEATNKHVDSDVLTAFSCGLQRSECSTFFDHEANHEALLGRLIRQDVNNPTLRCYSEHLQRTCMSVSRLKPHHSIRPR
jgi:hypothetical protein